MATNRQTVGRSLLPNIERERDAIVTIRQFEKRYRLIELKQNTDNLLSFRSHQIVREVDAPFVSRHNEFSELYNELVGDKNGYEQAFNTESNDIKKSFRK